MILWGSLALSASLALTGCSESAPSIMDPKGPAADRILFLTWLLFGLGGLVYIAVMAYLLIGLKRRRKPDEGPLPSAEMRKEQSRIVILGMGVTVVILLVVFGFTVDVLGTVSGHDEPSELTVRVTGKQWWWEIEYPGQEIITANEIHIPVDKRVLLELRSDDVIHSFWVPQLHGKRDLIPGRVNTFPIEASETGIFWGECAEFCGKQHAKMQFVVVVETQEEFDAWLQSQQQSAQIPDNPYYQRGQAIFAQVGCSGCHTIRGTDALGVQGPDLTHLASRQTIAAGALPNTIGHLGGWVADPQGIKPGNLMPNIDIPAEDFRALIDFLSILE